MVMEVNYVSLFFISCLVYKIQKHVSSEHARTSSIVFFTVNLPHSHFP